MAYLLGLKPSPPEAWELARLAKTINKTPPQVTAKEWQWLATAEEMQSITRAQTMLTSGQGHGLDADTLLYLKGLRDAAKEWQKN